MRLHLFLRTLQRVLVRPGSGAGAPRGQLGEQTRSSSSWKSESEDVKPPSPTDSESGELGSPITAGCGLDTCAPSSCSPDLQHPVYAFMFFFWAGVRMGDTRTSEEESLESDTLKDSLGTIMPPTTSPAPSRQSPAGRAVRSKRSGTLHIFARFVARLGR